MWERGEKEFPARSWILVSTIARGLADRGRIRFSSLSRPSQWK